MFSYNTLCRRRLANDNETHGCFTTSLALPPKWCKTRPFQSTSRDTLLAASVVATN